MIHDLLSSGTAYLCVDNIVDDVIVTVFRGVGRRFGERVLWCVYLH